jgi:hypothetical protein
VLRLVNAVRHGAPAPTGRGWRPLAPVLLGAAVVAILAAPAAADPIGTLQAQADRLAAQISSGTERVGTLTKQYNLAAEQQAAAASQLASAQSQLDTTRRSIGAAQDVLRQAAITAYIGQGTAASATSTVGGLAMDLVLRRQYLQVADGNLADGLDRFQAGVRDLQVREAALRQDQMAASSAAARVSAARQGALAAAAEAEGALAQVHGQLAQLVVQAEAAKAAKAAKAAQIAAAAAPQGLPVKGGLSAAIASAVSATPAPAPPAPVVTAPAPVSHPPTIQAPIAGPAPTTPPTPVAPVVSGGAGGVWAALRQCESGGNYAENTGNGYYGAYQFSQATWSGLGYPGRPDLAPPATQDQAAQRLQARSGWGQWPACAAALGLT